MDASTPARRPTPGCFTNSNSAIRIALVAAFVLAIAAATSFGSSARAQPVTSCDPAYGAMCALPGWDDPIDDQFIVMNPAFPIAAALTIPPCRPRTVMAAP
jgi:hypothetical protein